MPDKGKQPISKAKSTPKPKKTSDNPRSKAGKAPKKSELGDSTARVSAHPSKNEPGPAADSVGKTTDTRAPESKKPGTKKEQAEQPHPPTVEELAAEPTAAEIAENQPLRQGDLPVPTEILQVDGNPVEVGAVPSRVDPVEIKPSKRDTLIKDRARAEGIPHAADAPVQRGIGGDILEGRVGETRFEKDEKTGDLTVKGGFDG